MTKPKIIRRPDYFWFSHENFGFFQLLDDNTPGHQTSTARRTHLAMAIAGGPGPNFAAGVKNSRLGPPDQTGGHVRLVWWDLTRTFAQPEPQNELSTPRKQAISNRYKLN